MKKTNWLSLMLALVMCLFLLPADAQAKTITETVTISYTPSVDLPDSDEIFAAYVEREMYRPIYGDVSMFGSRAREQLNSNAQKLYDYLLPGLKEIAAGNRSSSEFTIPDLSELGISLGYSAEDLNVDSLIVDNAIPQSVVDAFSVAVDRDLMDDQMLVNALLSDCPYDMYWYDKSYADYDAQEFAFMYQMDITYQDGKLVPANVTISFRAADAYGSQYIIDTAKTGAASSAVANAQKIVDSCASLTNEAKLAAYRDEICDLVSYNTAAAEETYTGGYGDPWQLIYVFDGNSSTNVVCEGYSKAFQYLCDLSNFSGDVYCYSVTGTMTGGTGAGPHMWNIVQMNGGNYLVDVTNCDTDSIGHPDELFLVCEPASGTWETEYVIKVGDEQIIYAYDADTFSLWGESELKLCAPSHTHNWVDATCTTPKTCSECKATEGEALGHKWINATCTDPMTCSVCGATEGNALGHNFGEWEITTAPTCTQDGVQTRKCSACEETETENIAAKGHSMTLTAAVTPTCTTTGNNAYYTCGNCNKLFKDEAGTQETTAENEILPVLAHSYSKPVFTWAEDNTCKATYNCTVGGESATVDCTVSSVSKEASCKDSGEIVYTATVVISNTNYTDKKTVTVEALGHKYESVVTKPTCTEKGYTTHTCSVCNDTYTDSELPANGHSFGEWEITTAPTCTKDGVQTRKCSACDKIETEAISATGEHNYAAETERVDPTCTEDGYVIMACGCGAAQKSTLTAAGHKYESVVTEPTCTEKGYTTHTCSVCNDTYTDSELPANGHSFGEWEITTAPTCAEDGVQTRKCSACEETKTETISATGEHHYVSETERVDPTCTKDGYVIMACGCGATQKSELKAPGHTPGEAKRENEKPATCENAGSYDEVVRCATCNEIITSTPKTIDKLDHTPGEPVVENKVDATCLDKGSYDNVVYCTACKNELSREKVTVDALGHNYQSVVTAPTCTTDGYTTHTCSVCNDTYTDSELPANGHSFGEWEITTAPTCTQDGVQTRKCSACEETETDAISATGEHHYATETERVDPTCTEDGYVIMACGCGVTETTTLKATGHKYESVVTAPTCTEKGYTTHTCSVCDDTYTDNEVPATGEHNYATETERVDPTCTEDGYVIMACGCGAAQQTTLPATGHTPGEAKRENEKPATCENAGSYDEVVRCATCNEIITSTPKTIDKLDHTPGEPVVENKVDATCQAEGSYDEVICCTVCEDEISRVTKTIDKLTTHKDDDQNDVCDVCGKDLSNSVEVEEPENGKIEVNDDQPETGDEVIITITPEEGQEVGEVIVTDEQGNRILVTRMANGQYSFRQPAGKVIIRVAFKEVEPVLYTASIVGGNGSGSYAEGETVTISANAPADGMQFSGWTGAEGLTFTSGSVSTAQAAFTMPAADVTLTASYEAIADVKYIITFHANGGAGTMNPISVSAGKPVDLPACGYAAPEGLQFAGWSLSQDGAAIASPALFEADTTLYAVWTAAPVEDVKPVAPPKTGDDARLGLWTMLMLLSAAGIMASRKRRTN